MAGKATKAQLEAVAWYKALMGEVRVRIDAITRVIEGKSGLHPGLTPEFCFLQLRMICELIAMASLTAHGDAIGEKATKFEREYSADRLMKMLASVHPLFYPEPVQASKPEPHKHSFKTAMEPGLTEKELQKLYQKTGDILHRGPLRKLRKAKSNPNIPALSDVVSYTQKVVDLLGHHIVSLPGDDVIIICSLWTGPKREIQVMMAHAHRE